MGQLYVLKLRGGKWYVGYTDRSSMDRILEHIEKKGAKWTKAHPPLEKNYLHNFTTPGKTRKDEDKRTLSEMKKHGIENVRGGKWCMVKMRKKTYRELEGLIGKTNTKSTHKKKIKPKAKKKTKTKKSGYCIRTGEEIPFNIKKPFNKKSWTSWNAYKDKEYKEKFCHFSGEKSSGQTTYNKPILRKNWDKASKMHKL